MARRKKEPRAVHRNKIAAAAQELFLDKGIEAASMDDIARKAGYSKATLYVYFQNKEEIIGVLTLESMKKLYDYIVLAIGEKQSVQKRYDMICQALVQYQEEYPFYFKTVLEGINIDFEHSKCLPEEEETFRIGEEINKVLKGFLEEGIAAGTFRKDADAMSAIFSIWAMLSGLIQMAANKKAYIAQEMKLSQEEFLKKGFDMLYRSIAREENNVS